MRDFFRVALEIRREVFPAVGHSFTSLATSRKFNILLES